MYRDDIRIGVGAEAEAIHGFASWIAAQPPGAQTLIFFLLTRTSFLSSTS